MKNKHLICFLGFLYASGISAVALQTVEVSGDTSAQLSFLADGPLPTTPKMSVQENRIELLFPGVKLSGSLVKNSEVGSTHALVQKIQVVPDSVGDAKVKIIVNGSLDKLRDRVKLAKKDGSVQMTLAYASGSEATLKLLQEEQEALPTQKAASPEVRGGFGWLRLMLVLALFSLVGAGTWFGLKFAKRRVGWVGSRKHLIETLAQVPVGGGKASVAVLRVGTEFVMVGITGSNVSLLSTLPKLQEQYEEESLLDRESFREAIVQQTNRTRGGLSA